jgi:predicted transcriptional regulator
VTTTQLAKALDRKYSSVRRSLGELEAKRLVAGSYYIYSSPQVRALHCWLWRPTSDEERRSGRIDRRIDLRQADAVRAMIEEKAARVEEVMELEREIFEGRRQAGRADPS